MVLKELIKEGTDTISQLYPEREAREMVLAYLEHRLGITRHTHIIEPGYKVEESDVPGIRSDFARMASGEPLQYVTGKAWFYGRQFNVSPDVLIPRPETELLCRECTAGYEGVLTNGGDDMPPPARGCLSEAKTGVIGTIVKTPTSRILDLCTGSGCIAWTLALEIPGAEVTGIDISDGALTVASGQDFSEELARTSALKPHFVKADVLGKPMSDLGLYDIIVSNPPYVMDKEKALMRTNVLDHEPHLALFVSDDDPLIFYRAVAQWALLMLKPGGFGVVEINEALAPETEEVFRSSGFTDVRTIRDLNDRDRFVMFAKRNVPQQTVEQFV